MRKAIVYKNNLEAGIFTEIEFGKSYRFQYLDGYSGEPVSLTMPVTQRHYEHNTFPPFGYDFDRTHVEAL